jgi:hypothetical protein
MSNELLGNQYKYAVDTSYGINQDGFIAIGTESIVYKGLKTKRDGGFIFSCVLKFKPKSVKVGGEVTDRLSIFKNEEQKNILTLTCLNCEFFARVQAGNIQ